MDKTIIVIPGATCAELQIFKEQLGSNLDIGLVNKDIQVFKLKDGELFEIVNELKKTDLQLKNG